MNKPKLCLLVVFVFAWCQQSLGEMNISNNSSEIENILPFKEGRLLVKTMPSTLDDALVDVEDQIGARTLETYSLVPGLRLYEFDESIAIEDAQNAFLNSGLVEYVEPDFFATAAVQNDPRFSQQWALENIGQTGGVIDVDINANSMWAIDDGDPNIVIGVIDSGVDYNHSDLAANMWRNSGEIPGDGLDQDLNGYVDDVFGINAITNTGNPLDDNAHGTHVAGTIGAVGNNAVGIVGVMQTVRLAGCKFLAASGSGSTSDAIQCLQYFANLKTRLQNPVNIVATNNSWGSTSRSNALEDAIRAHRNLGILFIAAAGNSTANTDVTTFYPAGYDLSNVISVAATDHTDRIASFSNYGRRTVHVGAPGVRILSTVLNQSYAIFSGTSMAAPHVTGLAGIIKARFPNLDYKQIKNLIMSSGTPIAALQNTTISGRRIRGADINGRGALTCFNQVVRSRLKPLANAITITEGQSLFLSAVHINCAQPAGSLTLFNDSVTSVVLQDAGTNGDAVANDGVYSLLWRPSAPGNYALDFGNGDVVTVTVGDAPPTYRAFSASFSYESIVGSSLGAGDETIHTVAAPFPIRFNGASPGFSTLYVTANGTISFTTNVNPGYTNRSLPTTVASTLVAPYWDDLIPSGTNSNVYVATLGLAPNRRFVVEWRNLRHYDTSGFATFQVVFFENSADIRFNFRDTDLSNTSYNFGRSATVGVQSSTSLAALYSYNTASIPSSSSLLFRLD